MMQRREFLAAMAGAGASAAAPAAGYEPVIAAQAYVFSQAYARLNQRMEDRIPAVADAEPAKVPCRLHGRPDDDGR